MHSFGCVSKLFQMQLQELLSQFVVCLFSVWTLYYHPSHESIKKPFGSLYVFQLSSSPPFIIYLKPIILEE